MIFKTESGRVSERMLGSRRALDGREKTQNLHGLKNKNEHFAEKEALVAKVTGEEK